MNIRQTEADLTRLFEAYGGRDRDALAEAIQILRSRRLRSTGSGEPNPEDLAPIPNAPANRHDT